MRAMLPAWSLLLLLVPLRPMLLRSRASSC